MNALPLIAGGFLLLVGALCAAADGALLSLEPDRGVEPATASLGRQRSRAHRALGFARILTQLLAAAALTRALTLRDLPFGLAIMSALGIALLVVLLGDAIPGAIGERAGKRALDVLRPVTRAAQLLFSPAAGLAGWADHRLQRLLPREQPSESARESAAEHFADGADVEERPGSDEPAILRGVFSLGDIEVQEIMVPRVDIVGLDREASWPEAVERVLSSEHARLPVYDGTIDQIVGIIYAKDMLPSVIDGRPPADGWTRLIRRAAFVPESKPADEQLREFRATRTHIAIVVDEYGGTAGLVTIEDILEEIVGDIRDEYDVEEAPIEEQEGRRFWVSGRVSLDDLSGVLGHRFDRPDVATVGGLIFVELGRVPRAGEELIVDGYRVVVERLARRRIQRVYFERLEASPAPGNAAR